MPIFPSPGTCQAQITIAVPNPTVGIAPLRYYIGSTIVAGQVAGPAISIIAGLTTAAQIQALINADATYIAYQAANPGFLITVTGFDNVIGLTVQIIKPATVAITDNATGLYSDFSGVSSAFSCNLIHSGGGGGISPSSPPSAPPSIKSPKKFNYPKIFCRKRIYDKEYNLIPCPPEIYYPTINGKLYVLISCDNTQCCYKLKSLIP